MSGEAASCCCGSVSIDKLSGSIAFQYSGDELWWWKIAMSLNIVKCENRCHVDYSVRAAYPHLPVSGSAGRGLGPPKAFANDTRWFGAKLAQMGAAVKIDWVRDQPPKRFDKLPGHATLRVSMLLREPADIQHIRL